MAPAVKKNWDPVAKSITEEIMNQLVSIDLRLLLINLLNRARAWNDVSVLVTDELVKETVYELTLAELLNLERKRKILALVAKLLAQELVHEVVDEQLRIIAAEPVDEHRGMLQERFTKFYLIK